MIATRTRTDKINDKMTHKTRIRTQSGSYRISSAYRAEGLYCANADKMA